MTYNCRKCGGHEFRHNGKTPAGKQRFTCKTCGFRTTNPNQPSPKQNTIPCTGRAAGRYVVTSAQNNTPVHGGFFKSLMNYCMDTNADLLVIPFTYKSPTQATYDIWYDPIITPFLVDQRIDLSPKMVLLGNIRVNPTTVNPLTGLESLSGEQSCLVGNPKIALASIPTFSGKLPKLIASTGAVTVHNYSKTKTGVKGEFHHTLGAATLVLDGKLFHLRQLNATKDGSFFDLNKEYRPTGIKLHDRAAALVMGDTHARFTCPLVMSATFGAGGIVDFLRPEKLIWHDLLDQYARNHHHRGDPFTALAKVKGHWNDVQTEVMAACEMVSQYTPKDTESILVPSNHGDALSRWIKESDWRADPVNAQFYLETALAMVRQTQMEGHGASYPDAFSMWAKKLTNAKVLRRDESYRVHNIELSIHGDKGPNGARGSLMNISKIGCKSIIGHSHTPGIRGGTYQTGTSTRLNLAYTLGPSSWLNTHCVIYPNGKRSLINIIEGKWKK